MPVLQYSGRKRNKQSNTWVRPQQPPQENSSNEHSSGSQGEESHQQQEAAAPPIVQPQHHQPVLRGPTSWRRETAPKTSMQKVQNRSWKREDTSAQQQPQLSPASEPSAMMQKRGAHQLRRVNSEEQRTLLQKKLESHGIGGPVKQEAAAAAQQAELLSSETSSSSSASQSQANQTMKKVGSHKLVNKETQEQQQQKKKQSYNAKRPYYPKNHSGGAKNTNNNKGAKRIKLPDNNNNNNRNVVSESVSEESNASDEGKKKQKEMTDFAYREQGSGLVRVQAENARICPTFLRGLPCTNATCMKRHDVPKEHGMPVCSFFQRQGMCLKEDCPFRHVKVNPRALPCPSFTMLGFCDDADCTMMHTRQQSPGKTQKASGGVARRSP